MKRFRNRVNGGIVVVDEDFAARLDPTQWEPVEDAPKPARRRKKADDASGADHSS